MFILSLLYASHAFIWTTSAPSPVPNRPTSRPAPRPASPAGVEHEIQERDWRAFRAKLEGAGLDADAREAWSRGRSGWVHSLAAPEAGGLLLALPFSATLCHAASPYRNEVLRYSARRRMALGLPKAASLAKERGDDPTAWKEDQYRRDARLYADAETRRVVATPRDERTERDRRFMEDRVEAMERARDVVLVLSLDDNGGGVGLRLGLQDRCAPWGSRRRSAALYAALEIDGGGYPDFHEFDEAFGSDVAVFLGGRGLGDPDWEGVGWQGEAILLHARPGLDGATEIQTGCGIYRGGAAAAARLVADGQATTREFAFFVGRYEFGPGALRDAVRDGLYEPAACASSLLLGEAKLDDASLWRDLMRALGGTSAAVEALVRGVRLPSRFSRVDDLGPDDCIFGDS